MQFVNVYYNNVIVFEKIKLYNDYNIKLCMGVKMKKLIFINLFRICLTVVGLFLLILFIIPLTRKSSLHVGNITGIIISLFLIFKGVCYYEFKNFIINLKKNKYKKYILYSFRILLAIAVVIALVITFLMIKATNNKPVGNETVIVLGSRVYGNKPSRSLKERLDAAYEYLETNPDSYCIVSGGQGRNEDISEAECMYQYLKDKGIDEKRIFKEDKSTSTRENIKFSLEIIKANNLPEDIAITTSEYHQYRASLIAKKLGIDVKAVPSKTAWWIFPTMYLRELYGVLYEVIL